MGVYQSRTGEKMFVKKFSSKKVFDEHIQLIGMLHSGEEQLFSF